MTDIEGSTRAWDASPRSTRQALDHHDRVIVKQIEDNAGQIVESGREGDSILAVFRQATDAVACALEIQRRLQHEPWPAGAEMRVRIAVHTGEAELKSSHYVGVVLYRCARLLAIAHGGQVLVSTATEEIVADDLPPGVSLLDLGLHRLRDLSRQEHVYQLSHADLRHEFPKLKSQQPERSNLPEQLTSFVDREAELSALTKLIKEARLVTVLGPGGVGKSRLALQLARSLTEAGFAAWPDGMWWTELAAADDAAEGLVTALALPGQGAALDVVASWLAAKRALLILDNCEHIAEECARVCQALLERSPGLTILATSREPLRLPGENAWRLASLQEAGALQLFEVRAALVSPGFKVAQPNLEPISEICQRLDRMPLAIEMAASRLDVMSERDLLVNLTDRFRVLASGARTAPERQQTLAATIDWSYRLLTEAEAELFRRLAVFQGGFTLEAAQAVCGAADRGTVLPLLAALVQKSMVVADRLSDGSTRYRMLESHHDFAVVKLRESADHDIARRRHYEHFRAQKWKPAESANFWSALTWARDHVDDCGLALAIEVGEAGYSQQARARAVLLELLDCVTAPTATRARALNVAARLTSRQGDHAQSKSLADASVAGARELNDAQLVAQTLSGAGVVYHGAGDLDAARRMYDEALSLLKGSRDRPLAIEVQNQMAVLATEQGQFQTAFEMLKECLSFSRSESDAATTARYLESLANVEMGLGDASAAAGHWREALTIFNDLDDPFGTIWCIGGLALVASNDGAHERALRLIAVVDRMSREWSLTAWSDRIRQLGEANADARIRLGGRKADDAWKDGLAMSPARALEYSLGGETPQAAVDAGPLSRREREVAAMVAAGMTNKQIAERLFIAERTAEGHVERIRNKLGVRSRTEVATWAVARGIVARDLDKGQPPSTV